MAKPEWGTKRNCHACGAAFYDLRRSPAVCPKCGAEYDPEAILKSRRSRAPLPDDKVAKPSAVPGVDPELEADPLVSVIGEDADAADSDVAEDEDDELMEDTSDLVGEDEDDMAEVMENLDEGDDER